MKTSYKRKGTIALAAAHTLTVLAMAMDDDQARIFHRGINRWLDNGHNLDAADVEWLAQEARDSVAVRREAGVPIR